MSKIAQITSEDSATQVSLYDEGENGIEKLKGFHDPKDGVIGINTRTTDMTSAADKVEVAAHEGYHRQLDNPSYSTETEEALADDMGKRAARYWQQENGYKGVDANPRLGVDNKTWNQANAGSEVIAKGNRAVAGKGDDEVETLGFVAKQAAKSWAKKEGKNFRNLDAHYTKHGKKFNAKNAKEYQQIADDFIQTPPKGTLTKKRNNGDTVYYNPSSNTFAVKNKSGEITTMFKPSQGKKYFDRQ